MKLRDNDTGQRAVKLILNASPNARLLKLRAQMLNDAGYYTSSAHTTDEALRHAQTMNCAVALVCYSFDGEERRALTQRLHTVSPKTTIVCLDAEADQNQSLFISRIERALARMTA